MRPYNRNSNTGRRSGNGPLLTEHLRDLDLELELLKRKREMIEKQQNLLNQQQAFNRQSYNYDQPQSYRNQQYNDGQHFSGNSNRDFMGSSRDDDYTQLYDEPQQSHNTFPRQSAKKRLGDYVWPEPLIKRPFGSPKKVAPAPIHKPKYVPPSERPGFIPPRNQPVKPRHSQRFRERPQRRRPNDFNPTRVTKSYKPNPPVVNISNNVVAEPPKNKGDDQILRPDQVPSPQVAGRLELALGNILKCVKDKYGKEPENRGYFAEHSSSRVMKQVIRERIRNAMLGKPVGNITQIIQTYREVYPDDTDREILEAAIKKKDSDVGKAQTFVMSHSAELSPYQFFKKNYSRLMATSLNRMFDKLRAIAKEESAQMLKLEAEEKDKEKPETNDGTAEIVDTTETEHPKDVEAIEDVEKSTENADNFEESLEKSTFTAEDPKDAEKSNENIFGIVEEEVEQPKYDDVDSQIYKKYLSMINQMMPKKLAYWMPRLKTQIMRAMAADMTFVKAKEAIINETNALLSAAMEDESDAPPSDFSKFDQALLNRKSKNLEYHVKIQGRPLLPQKSLMKEFLKDFNPKIIKKIKNVRNLLFVSFDNKDDFDRMVAANGTVVGTDKIIVKISTWVTKSALRPENKNASTPNTSINSDKDASTTEETEGANDELNNTLDNQIDELLTSIRSEEESGQVEDKNENTGEAIEGANADDNQDAKEVVNVDVDMTENEKPGEAVDLIEDGENENETKEQENNTEAETENSENGTETVGNEENVAETAAIRSEEESGQVEGKNENTEEAIEGANADDNRDSKEVVNVDVDMTENEKPGEAVDLIEDGENANENETKEQENNTEAETENSENGTETVGNEENVAETAENTGEEKDKVEDLKTQDSGKATPVRASSRLANTGTPSTIRTRRASRLAQN